MNYISLTILLTSFMFSSLMHAVDPCAEQVSVISKTKPAATSTGLVTVQQEPVTVASVDLNIIIEHLDEWKDEQKRINKEGENKLQQIKNLEDSYRKKATELQSMGGAIKDTAREAKTEELMSLQNEMEIKKQSAQAYMQRIMQEAQYTIGEKIKKEVEDYAKELNIDLVLINFGVFYASPKVDISIEIAERMNKKYNAEKKKKEAAAAKSTTKK